MPPSRVKLRNDDFGLGVPQMNNIQDPGDPKALLDGLSVASLVHLLRQFGDLSQYAAQVFHGLQEEMATTASRSRNLMTRMKCVEAALPPIEKSMLSQTSHVQYVYAPGSEWHSCIEDKQNHFIYTDLPHRIMDSYEDCREPPRLQLLDKFDPGGPGSCLTRYSDPTFFRKVTRNSESLDDVKSNKDRKKRRARKRSSSQLPYDASNFNLTDKVQSSSQRQQRKSSPPQTASTFGNTFKSEVADQTDSVCSGDWTGLNESVPHQSASVRSDKTKTKKLSLESGDELIDNLEIHDDPRDWMLDKSGCDSSIFTWDGKVDIAEPMILNYGMQGLPSLHATSSEFGTQEIEPRLWIDGNDEAQEVNETKPVRWNSRSHEVQEVHGKIFKFDQGQFEPFLGRYSWGNRIPEAPEINRQRHDEQVKESKIGKSVSVACKSFEGVDSSSWNFIMNQPDDAESETENFVDALNSIDSECENDLDCQRKGAADNVSSSEGPKRSESFTHPSEYALWKSMHSSNVSSSARGRKGGVLSLQPPKYPGFGTYSDGVNVTTSTTVDPWSQHPGPKGDNLLGNLGSLARYLSYDNGNTDHHEAESSKELGLDRSLNNSVVSAQSRTQLVQMTIPPEDKDHSADNARNSLDGAVPLSEKTSSFLSGLGHHRSQMDGFRRTRSMEYNEKPNSVTQEKPLDHGNALHSSFTRRKSAEETPSSMTSAPASPPLDHMSISFQPAKSIETTKLKLKVPKGSDPHSETTDAFPSFQLVPEPNLQPQFNSDTDDDDDTFCRSNPCISDDDIRNHYGPDSELWDSPDSTESSDPIPCDGFAGRTTSGGSASSSIEPDHTTNKRPLSDFPLLKAMNPLVFQESNTQSYPKAPVEPFDLRELTPALPPLPPLQWRVLKPHSDALEGKGSSLDVTALCTEPKNHGSKPLGSAQMKLDEQKEIVNDVQEKTSKTEKRGGEVDDFLHQIREKGFNLRKTGLLNLSPTPVAPVANGKMAAILAKAKTIRQVMASDEGEDDDHWSDS